jgi:hypothetical protein
MTTDFSLMDVMGNFVGGPADPSYMPNYASTATAQVSETPAPKQYINPKFALKTSAVAPMADTTSYNANIAQQESGGRPDIGYHDKSKSTAFGPYGITAGAYQDARKVNPTLPEDITKTTPEQQTQAQDAFTQQNAKYLQSYGVEVNPNTLAAAHFLGAKGLSDYLRDGTISPAAARANGGEDKVREIVNKRLGGQPAPASGATQAPAPASGATQAPAPAAPVSPEQAAVNAGQGLKFQGQIENEKTIGPDYATILNSNSAEQIGKMAYDVNTPKDIQSAAYDKLFQTTAIKMNMDRAQKIAADLGTNPDPRALNRAMNDKETGNYFKVLMYQLMGWEGKAKEELDKINPKTAYGQTTLNGVNYRTKFNPNTNEIYAAWDPEGEPADQKTLNKMGAEGFSGMGKKLDIVGGTYVNDTTGEVGRVVTDEKTGRSFVQTDKGMRPMTGFRPQGQGGTLADMRTRALQDLQIKLTGKTEEEKMQILRPYNQQLVSNGYQPIQPTELGITAPVVQGAPAQARPQAAPAAAVAPQAGAVQAAPVVPGTPAATGQMPPTAQPAGTGPGGRPTKGEMERRSDVAKEEALAGPKAEAAGQKDMVEQSTKIVQQFPDLRNTTDAVNKSIKLIDSGDTNLGPSGSIFSGDTKANQLPFEKEFERWRGTKDARNTKTVMDLVVKLAADGLKALGSNPSTVDLEFWTKNKPTEYDAPEYTKEWLETRRDDLERRIQYHKDVIKNKGRVPEVIPGTPTQTGEKIVLEEKTVNGVTYVYDGKGWKRK